MTKAILVIDMPNDCLYCPCMRHNIEDDGTMWDDCKVALRPLTVEERDNKPTWCPLIEMPKKIEYSLLFDTDEINGEHKPNTNFYTKIGYNACVDEILGEKE